MGWPRPRDRPPRAPGRAPRGSRWPVRQGLLASGAGAAPGPRGGPAVALARRCEARARVSAAGAAGPSGPAARRSQTLSSGPSARGVCCGESCPRPTSSLHVRVWARCHAGCAGRRDSAAVGRAASGGRCQRDRGKPVTKIEDELEVVGRALEQIVAQSDHPRVRAWLASVAGISADLERAQSALAEVVALTEETTHRPWTALSLISCAARRGL